MDTMDQSGTPTRARGRSQTRRAQLQADAFYLSVEGRTFREIAKRLGISKTTVVKYVRAEEELRVHELVGRRETEKARRLARLYELSRAALDARWTPASGGLAACARFEEMINRILGVDSPTKIDVGLQQLVDALNGGDDPTRALE